MTIQEKYEAGDIDLVEAAKQMESKVRQIDERIVSIDVGDLPKWWFEAFANELERNVTINNT